MSGLKREHRFTVTPEHLILDPRVSDRAMRLWCRLDRFAGDKESAYPSKELLAIELNTSPSSVERATKELIAADWLRCEQRPGQTSLYVLTVAPTKETERLIKQSRDERKQATEPRREKAAERDRQKKADARAALTVNRSQNQANAQVSDGSPITGDEGTDSGPENLSPVMGDEGARVTGDEGTPVMGDGEKEATPEGSIIEGDSETSLRSVPAAPSTDALPIDGIETPAAEQPAETPVQQSYRIVRAYLDWFELGTKAPIVNKPRVVAALQKSYVLPALESGYAEDAIKLALAKTGEEFPSQASWRRCLRDAAGGTNPDRPSQFTRQGAAYTDERVWGTKEEREERAAVQAAKSEAELEAEAQAQLERIAASKPQRPRAAGE